MEQVEAGNYDWRDVAVLTEYLQQVGDVLDDMQINPPRIIPGVSDDTVEKLADLLGDYYEKNE